MLKNKLFILLGLIILTSCSHSVHQYEITDYEYFNKNKKSKVVSATSSQTVILGFSFDTDYVEEAKANLIKQCPNNNITGIGTRFSTSHGFFHWKNIVMMQGHCI